LFYADPEYIRDFDLCETCEREEEDHDDD